MTEFLPAAQSASCWRSVKQPIDWLQSSITHWDGPSNLTLWKQSIVLSVVKTSSVMRFCSIPNGSMSLGISMIALEMVFSRRERYWLWKSRTMCSCSRFTSQSSIVPFSSILENSWWMESMATVASPNWAFPSPVMHIYCSVCNTLVHAMLGMVSGMT